MVAEQDAKNLMYEEYLELQLSFERYKDEQKEMEDPVVLRLALDQCRRDLSKAQAKINEYRYSHSRVRKRL